MRSQAHESLTRRLPRHRLALVALASCALLAACGGGGGDDKGDPVTPLSQSDATADAANASSTGSDTAAALDTLVDTATALAPVLAATAAASPERARVESARPETTPAAPSISGTVACPGGGTATMTVIGGSLELLRNGQLDLGEDYKVTYAQCSGGAGLAKLDGSVEMVVTAADRASSPSSVAVNLTVTHLVLSLPAGDATLAGSATLSRSVATTGGTTTTTSHVSVPSATLATAFNSRTGSFTLSDLDATRVVTSVDGVTTASQYNGHHTLAGTAWGRTFSMTVATTGNVDRDANGTLVSGAWTVVRPHATVATTIANGLAVITVDDGNDGTIDHSWTFPAAQLAAAAG